EKNLEHPLSGNSFGIEANPHDFRVVRVSTANRPIIRGVRRAAGVSAGDIDYSFQLPKNGFDTPETTTSQDNCFEDFITAMVRGCLRERWGCHKRFFPYQWFFPVASASIGGLSIVLVVLRLRVAFLLRLSGRSPVFHA